MASLRTSVFRVIALRSAFTSGSSMMSTYDQSPYFLKGSKRRPFRQPPSPHLRVWVSLSYAPSCCQSCCSWLMQKLGRYHGMHPRHGGGCSCLQLYTQPQQVRPVGNSSCGSMVQMYAACLRPCHIRIWLSKRSAIITAWSVCPPVIQARRHGDAEPRIDSCLEAHAHGVLEVEYVVLCSRRAHLTRHIVFVTTHGERSFLPDLD